MEVEMTISQTLAQLQTLSGKLSQLKTKVTKAEYNNIKYITSVNSNTLLNVPVIVGLELEFYKNSGIHTAYRNNKLLNINASHVDEVNDYLYNYLTEFFDYFLYKPVHNDGNNMEFALLPFDLNAYTELKELIDIINKVTRLFNFRTFDFSSLQVNLPKEEISSPEVLKRLLWAIFGTSEMLFDLSDRYSISEMMASLYHMLGVDPLNDNYDTLKSYFIETKDHTLELYSYNDVFKILGIVYNKKKSNRIEFRWCRNTQNVEHTLLQVEYIVAIVTFANRIHFDVDTPQEVLQLFLTALCNGEIGQFNYLLVYCIDHYKPLIP